MTSFLDDKIILYQWPGGTGTESIFPRSVAFQRICNLARIDAEVMTVTIPEPGEHFLPKLRQRLASVPLMEVGEERFTDSNQIIRYLLSVADAEGLSNLRRLDVSTSLIIQEWANLVFINSLVYARWAREWNFQRFTHHVEWGKVPDQDASLRTLRTMIQDYLKRKLFDFPSEAAFEQHLRQQFISLEIKLMGQDYFEPFATGPTLTDLYVFMVVQGFYSSDLEESEWIKRDFPYIQKWFQRVDEQTKT